MSAVKRLITGAEVSICDECVSLCQELIGETTEEVVQSVDTSLTPTKIKWILDQHVVGQEQAKKTLAVAIFNHTIRVQLKDGDESPIQKSNVLFIGPSGTGKTFMVQTIAKNLDIPFVISDATSLTEAGYVGDDVESCLSALYQAADYDVELAERGIVVIDEICKLSRKSASTSVARDVSGEGVQQALLKIIEGTVVNVPPRGGRKHPQQEMIQINTADILFICCGAFDGLEDIVSKRLGSRNIGFSREHAHTEVAATDPFVNVEPDDLIQYGIIPELVGRLPMVMSLKKLTEDDLVHILTSTKSALVTQYKQLFEQFGVTLTVDDQAVRAIAKKAIARGVNARGLRTIMENLLLESMFSIPGQADVVGVVVNKDTVELGLQPEIIYQQVANK